MQRIEALQRFTEDYPESALRPRATELALETELRSFPERTEAIHRWATQQIAEAPAGLERWIEEARVADALASAQPNGADLPDARHWAQEALGAMTPEGFRRETAAVQRRYKLPPLTAREVRRDFLQNRVMFLAAMAKVELREGKPEAAEPLLGEAYRLDPVSSEVNELRGELALTRHQDGPALEAFERAEATGALPDRWRAEMQRLYEGGGGTGGKAGLEEQIDAVYRRLFPAVFTLPPRKLPTGGHTVLLELFTGSGCLPCVASDLAVESLLTTYGRRDLAVLEYDEHIPRPDPLTNPASEARAAGYRVGTTPEAFLDGQPLPVAGSTRGDAENVVVGFADELEDEAAQPSPLRLDLRAAATGGAIRAQVTVLPAVEGGMPLPAKLVAQVALVEDHVRYSGENGVRFHRMVVRALGPETRLQLPAGSPPAGQAVEARFDVQSLQQGLRTYLDAYERENDRFGEVRFLTKDLPFDAAQLGVVAWVQDPATHQILQAAYASAGVQGSR